MDMDTKPEPLVTETNARGYASGDRAPLRVQARPEVAIFGEWNTSNLGDRAIHHEVRRYFSACGWRVSSFGIGSLSPAGTGDGHGGGAAHDSRLRTGLAVMTPRLKRIVRDVRQRVRARSLLPRLRHVQAISVGGGALLSDANMHFPQSLSALAHCARALDKPLLCLGCSAEGEWSEQGGRMIRNFLGTCALVAVRDAATAGRLAGVLPSRPPIFGDFCLSEARFLNAVRRTGGRRDIAVNVCQLAEPSGAAQADYEDALVALVNGLARRAEESAAVIKLFTTGIPEDARAAERVTARLSAHRITLHLPHDLAQLSSMLETSALVVATRLHAAILSLAESVPVVGIAASAKLGNFFSTVGIGRYCYGFESVPQLAEWLAHADYEALFSEQRRAIVHSPVWSSRMEIEDELVSLAVELRPRREDECAP